MKKWFEMRWYLKRIPASFILLENSLAISLIIINIYDLNIMALGAYFWVLCLTLQDLICFADQNTKDKPLTPAEFKRMKYEKSKD